MNFTRAMSSTRAWIRDQLRTSPRRRADDRVDDTTLREDFVEFVGVSKRFPGVLALDNVTFSASSGSVRALIGENGAGKSTLLRILAGAHQPTGGHLRIAGTSAVFQDTFQAIEAGVAVIYQEMQLVPQLSVAENIHLGQFPEGAFFVDFREMFKKTRENMRLVGLDGVSPNAKAGSLSLGQRQMVEISRALTRSAKIIAFDEPTSSLSSRETDMLFAIIRRLRDEGKTIFYVSHRLDEIFNICDSVTVFRDGRHVSTRRSLAGVSRDELVRDMVGRRVAGPGHHRSRNLGGPALRVDAVMGPGLRRPVSLEVARGEVVGCFGLVGAGRTELLRLLFGAEARTGGRIEVFGQPVEIGNPAEAIRAGIMLCPEDRKKEGIIPGLPVRENVNISARRHHSSLGFLDAAWERENAAGKIRLLGIRTPSDLQLVKNLSGGNQQKTILARWLSERIKVLLLDEPTRGIDVGSRAEIYEIIHRLADEGIGIIAVSSDLPEVMGITDRILVFSGGALSGEVRRGDGATPADILSLALPPESRPRREGGRNGPPRPPGPGGAT